MYGRGEVQTGVRWVNLRESDRLKDLDVDKRIILKWLFKKRNGGGLANDTGRLWGLINAAMSF
jgi:hypothetical protein